MKYIIMTGNPVDGFVAIGPFDTNELARNYVETEFADRSDWWITELVGPQA